MIVKKMLVILGAGLLLERGVPPPIALDGLPGLVVGVRIVHPNLRFQRLAVVGERPTLSDVQLLGMGS